MTIPSLRISISSMSPPSACRYRRHSSSAPSTRSRRESVMVAPTLLHVQADFDRRLRRAVEPADADLCGHRPGDLPYILRLLRFGLERDNRLADVSADADRRIDGDFSQKRRA